MDDELPPDPFPGDPFAEHEAKSGDVPPGAAKPGPSSDGTDGFDLSALAGLFGGAGFGMFGSGAAGAGGAGGANPLAGLFAQLGGAGVGFNYDVARHTAIWSASGGEVESNLDPMERIGYEKILKKVLPAVAETLGNPTTLMPMSGVSIDATTRSGFAAEVLSDMRTLFDGVALGLASGQATPANAADTPDEGSEFAAIGQMMAMFGPMTLAPQIGSLIGELAKDALGSSDVFAPRASNRILIVPKNIAAFANEWSIDEDVARTHAVLVGATIQSVLSIEHIRIRLLQLLSEYAKATRMDTGAIASSIQGIMEGTDGNGGIDFDAISRGDLSGLGDRFDQSNPQVRALSGDRGLPGLKETLEQQRIRRNIRTLIIPVIGVVEYAVAVTGARLIGDNRQVMEAWRRRRANPVDATKSLSLMLGYSTDKEDLEAATAFVGGVMQRGGPDGLQSLWINGQSLPTEAEVAAPGLWLARLGLD
jgi:putative hydrolase